MINPQSPNADARWSSDVVKALRERASGHRKDGWESMREGDPGLLEEAADAIEWLQKIRLAAINVACTINGGFIACPCGRQESTTDIDFAKELYEALGIAPKL